VGCKAASVIAFCFVCRDQIWSF